MDQSPHTVVIVDVHPTEPTSQKRHQSNALCTCGRGWMWVYSDEIRQMIDEHALVDHENQTNIARYS